MKTETNIPYKYYLEESELPTAWYNVRADMKNKPAPLLNPGTLQPMTAKELDGVFCDELVQQELDDTTPYFPIPQEILEYPPFEVATVKNPVLDGKRLRNTASLHDHGRNLRVVSVEQLHTPVKHPLCGIRNSIHEDGLVPDDSEVGIALVGQGKIDMRRLEGENDADRGIPVAGRGESLLILGIADNAAPGAIGLDRFQTNPIIVQLIFLRPCLRG